MFLMIIYNDITCYVLDDHFEKMIFELADAACLLILSEFKEINQLLFPL